LIEMIKSSIEHGRALISDIEPLRDIKIGLIPAIKNIIARRYSAVGTRVEFECNCTIPEFDKFVKINILRIIQEALLNAQKHAESSNIQIKLFQQNDKLCVNITDNGVGFSSKTRKSQKATQHYGLLTMQERAHLIGGTLSIKSKPGKGTTVKAVFPLKHISQI